MERLEEQQPSEDVDGVQVLSVCGVSLELPHVIPVLQRQSDLQPEEEPSYPFCLNVGTTPLKTTRVQVLYPDLLGGRAVLTMIQAVQQVEPPHSDLEVERRQEEGAGSVQGQATEHPLLSLHGAAETQEWRETGQV